MNIFEATLPVFSRIMGCHGNHAISDNQMGVLLRNIEFLHEVASLNHLKSISNAPRNSM